MSDQKINLIELVIATTALILLLSGFIVTILNLYQKKQFDFRRNIEEIKLDHEKEILRTQLEIQERTLQNVSRDIHDNIALGLTLSKLHLNTLDYPGTTSHQEKINLAIGLIGNAIEGLSNISKSLNADAVKKYGLLKAVENEIDLLGKTGLFETGYDVAGTPLVLDARTELVVFRIIQESLNNIIKHSHAQVIVVRLEYSAAALLVSVKDDGVGFYMPGGRQATVCPGLGLDNIRQRARMIQGDCTIESMIGAGTTVRVRIPLTLKEENNHYG